MPKWVVMKPYPVRKDLNMSGRGKILGEFDNDEDFEKFMSEHQGEVMTVFGPREEEKQ